MNRVDLFQYADDIGPIKIIHIYNPKIGLKGILAIDNVAAGPSIGGIRMAPDVTVEEAFRLARAMTLKNAAAGLPHGGGKSVIQADPGSLPGYEKEFLIRAFARAIEDLQEYIPGPDMGTDETCMAWIHNEIGRSVGLPREIGGIPLDEIGATALGLVAAGEVACLHYGVNMKGARVALQGFGAVGKHSARFFAEKGAVIVAVADSGGTISNPNGLDPDALIRLKDQNKSVIEYPDGDHGSPQDVIKVECDIWIPAARPDVIQKTNVQLLNTKLILEGANIPISVEAEEILFRKGVHVIPDFIANAGGVICASVEYHGGTETIARESIRDKISYNTKKVIDRAESEKTSPRQAAEMMAMERVKKAMKFWK